ncbi:hypothetical protein C4E24_06915, partial [ANME-1 cluster archaeon AG-394-G21]|nr:hypothetical protein [ANME-1 cluster archaeon AG-394-G21]
MLGIFHNLVSIYNYALNQSEIKEDMEKCTPSTLVSLAEAVDNSGLTWFTGGDADWSGQTLHTQRWARGVNKTVV